MSIGKCNTRKGEQHQFLPIKIDNENGYSCPTCETLIIWREHKWVEFVVTGRSDGQTMSDNEWRKWGRQYVVLGFLLGLLIGMMVERVL